MTKFTVWNKGRVLCGIASMYAKPNKVTILLLRIYEDVFLSKMDTSVLDIKTLVGTIINLDNCSIDVL